jgi:citrate synthase
MNGPELLQENADRLRTRMGACFPGSRAVFRGYDLHAELKEMDWVELYLFGVTGRRFTPEQVRLLHAMWVYTSYPDARIWNNRVAALAGSARSTPMLALSAALAVTEAVIYGGHPGVRAIDFIQQARIRAEQGEPLAEVVRKEVQVRRIYGYGRPINSADERNAWLLALARELNLDEGPHLRFAFEVERILLSGNKALRMNYAGLVSALAADLGISPKEFHLFIYPLFLAGMPPCYVEHAERPEGTLFPLSCAHINYEGPPKRQWRQPLPPSS